MAEPQPSGVQEGAADPHAPTGTTLDAPQEGDDGSKKEVDGKALDKAMKELNVKDKNEGEKRNVKIEAADVTLLVCRPCERWTGRVTSKYHKISGHGLTVARIG
jgi:hypothetical protein